MYFCNCCRVFVDFNIFIKQSYIVLKNSKKCELYTRYNYSDNVFKSANCKEF